MYNQRLCTWIDEVFMCNSCKELINTMLDIDDRVVQSALIEFQGDELYDSGYHPADRDVLWGDFIVYSPELPHKPCVVFLVGPEDENKKFSLYMFPFHHFHIDQTQAILGIDINVRRELIYTLRRMI